MNGATRENGALSIEEVLAEEVEAIHGDKIAVRARDQDVEEKRRRLNGDQRRLSDPDAVKPRDEFYRALNRLNRAALCCSGGGIRSATFCLGVIQALANYDVNKKPPALRPSVEPRSVEPEAPGHQPAETTPPKPASTEPINAKNSALGRFHYLSTVSGGGYVGSWLSSWRKRSDFETLIRNLTSRPNGADIEPPELSWLRAYSNYLTPRLGIASADSWSAVAIYVRNLILNWLVIIPTVCLVLLALKLIATASVWVARMDEPKIMIGFLVFGAIFLIIAQVFTNFQRPSRRIDRADTTDWTFVFADLIWALLSAIFITIFLSSHYFATQLKPANGSADPKLKLLVIMAVAGLLIYSVGWIAALRFRKWSDFVCWALSGLIYGALVGLGAYLFNWLGPYSTTSDKLLVLLIAMTFGVPWMLASQLVAEIVFVGLSSYGKNGDADREWLGRAGGWVVAAAVAWALIAFLVFYGGYFVQSAAVRAHQAIVASGGIVGTLSGIATALLGSSSKTPPKSSGKDRSNWTAAAYNMSLAVVGPLFVIVLIIALSVALDQLLLGDSLVNILQTESQSTSTTLSWLAIGVGIIIIVGGLASYFVNINRFSLHALYRNRLIRCYLGATNEQRDPDPFTGFDFKDNVYMHELWPPKSGGRTNPYSLFHVINIALNVVSTKRLAWQERKAESFTVSPRHCGSAYLGFRRSEEYGDYPGKGSISLGTAMAISGAAVSPNMGYHSSPSIALLLTLFNERLGWWLGNPGKAGEKTYQTDGPKWAARPLFEEAFGQTTDNSPYVYLSDGGHFENLGLYEMVRRRCRLIVLIDAGCDGDFAFEDLGNAVRKIYIDLGIRITFKDLDKMKNRPSTKSLMRDSAALASLAAAETTAKGSNAATPGEMRYHAIGTIHYREAECAEADDNSPPAENGYILYIKPAYHGTETSAGIRSYATANPKFPHQATLDQWFTESQFESYRSLGLDIANDILRYEVMLCPKTKLTLHDALKALKVTFER